MAEARHALPSTLGEDSKLRINTERSRDEVPRDKESLLQAYSDAYGLLDAKNDSDLRDVDKVTKQTVAEAKRKGIDEAEEGKRGKFKLQFKGILPGRRSYTIQEGLPVDGLIDFLHEEVVGGRLSETDRDRVITLRDTLIYRSHWYSTYFDRWKSEHKRLSRIQHEADQIAADPLQDQGNPRENFLEAVRKLQRRRVLTIPGTPRTPRVRTPEPPEPGPIPDPIPYPPVPVPPEPAPIPRRPRIIPEPPEPPVPPISIEPPPPEPVQPPEEIMYNSLIARRDEDPVSRSMLQAGDFVREQIRRGKAYNVFSWPRKLGLTVMQRMFRDRVAQAIQQETISQNNAFVKLDMPRSVLRARDFFRRNPVRNLKFDTASSQAAKPHEEEAGRASLERARSEGGLLATEQLRAVDNPEMHTWLVHRIIRPLVTNNPDFAGDPSRVVQDRLREFVDHFQANPDVQQLFGREASKFSRVADYFATDMISLADRMRHDVTHHRFALDQIDQHIKFSLADLRWSAKTEVGQMGISDRAVAWLQKRRGTSLGNSPTLVGAAVSLATFGLGAGARYATRTAGGEVALPLASIGFGSLGGALVAAARRNYQLKVDRATHQAEVMEFNRQIEPGSRRRERMQQFSYNAASVEDLLGDSGSGLRSLLGRDLSQTANQEAVANRMAEIRTRLDQSIVQKSAFVTYSGEHHVEQGALSLVRGIAEARIALGHGHAGHSNAEIQALSDRFTTEWTERLTQNKEERDRAFRTHRIKHSLAAGALGGVTGMAGGVVSQAAFGFIGERVGVNVAPTIAEWLYDKAKPLGAVLDRDYSVPLNTLSIGASLGSPVKFSLGDGIEGVTDGGKRVVSLVKDGREYLPQTPLFFDNGRMLISGTLGKTGSLIRPVLGILPHVDVNDPDYNLRSRLREFAEAGNGGGAFELDDNHTMTIRGDDVAIRSGRDLLASGNIDSQTGLINFDLQKGVDAKEVSKVLEKYGFETNIATEEITGEQLVHKSLDQEIREFIARVPQGKTESMNLPGDIKLTVTGGKDGIDVVQLRDLRNGVTVYASITESGEIRVDPVRNSQVDRETVHQVIGRLRREGFEVSEKTIGGGTEIVERPVSGSEGVWKEHETNINEYQWYAYNTPYSEENELQMYTYKKGDTLILDMSTMDYGYQLGLKPNPIDVQETIRNGEASFVFRLAGREDAIVIKEGADGTRDGLLHLDPNDNAHYIDKEKTMTIGEFTKMVINEQYFNGLQDGNIATEPYSNQQVFDLCRDGNIGYIHAGRVVDRGGNNIVQSFATIRGFGQARDTIQLRTETPGERIFVLTPPDRPGLVPQPPVELTQRITALPPGAVEVIVPGIATPFAPRLPLEQLRASEPEETEEPAPITPYEPSPYDTYITSEEERRELAEAHGDIERFIRRSPYLLDSEKDDATQQVKEYLNSTEGREAGPQMAENIFERMYTFLATTPDIATLFVEDGTVPGDTHTLIQPIVSTYATEDDENDLIQVLGKFIISQPRIFNPADADNFQRRARVAMQAYFAAYRILV